MDYSIFTFCFKKNYISYKMVGTYKSVFKEKYMINIKIYCSRNHEAYERIYDIINEVMCKSNHCFEIKRISEPKILRMQKIVCEPHVVFNSQVVYTKTVSSGKDLKDILQRLKLIK